MNRLPVILITLLLLLGCKTEIGDDCAYDIDCSPDGERTCDRSQPDGYCLIITCSPDQCPQEAGCVEFMTPSPSFDTDDTPQETWYELLEQNRLRTYCLRRCSGNSDCRAGYYCIRQQEYETELNARIIDTRHSDSGICVPTAAPMPMDTDTADLADD